MATLKQTAAQQFIMIDTDEQEIEGSQNHIAAAAHLEAAARHHRKAAQLLALGNHEKARKSLHTAQSHHYLALEYAGIKEFQLHS